jgi:hypothetical protein
MDEFRLERDQEVMGDRSRNSRPWNESVRDARVSGARWRETQAGFRAAGGGRRAVALRQHTRGAVGDGREFHP